MIMMLAGAAFVSTMWLAWFFITQAKAPLLGAVVGILALWVLVTLFAGPPAEDV